MISLLGTSMALALPVDEKLSWHPKFVYRQIGGGYTLALEKGRQPRTFFVCEPNKTNCISTKEIGWQKPFIIYRKGDLLRPRYAAVDTTRTKHSESAQQLNSVPPLSGCCRLGEAQSYESAVVRAVIGTTRRSSLQLHSRLFAAIRVIRG